MVGTERLISGQMTPEQRRLSALYASMESSGLNPKHFYKMLAALIRADFPKKDDSESEERAAREFQKLIQSPYPSGLGTNPEEFLKLLLVLRHPNVNESDKERYIPKIAKEIEEVNKRVEALVRPSLSEHGGSHSQGSITTLATDRGESYTVRRLKRDYPELADRVLSGELSANAAAKEAGFRKSYLQIPVDDPNSTANIIISRASIEYIRILISALSKELASQGG